MFIIESLGDPLSAQSHHPFHQIMPLSPSRIAVHNQPRLRFHNPMCIYHKAGNGEMLCHQKDEAGMEVPKCLKKDISVSGSACKEPGSHHSIQITRKKLNSEKATLVGSLKEDTGKTAVPKTKETGEVWA